MGNSEVGHLNIGAGRVVLQDLPRINAAIDAGELAKAPALRKLIASLRNSRGVCHLIGLVSPGGVHSQQDHGAALAQVLASANVTSLVHVITDGRDTPPEAAADYVARFSAQLPRKATIGTVSGRYYAMDRDNRWDRIAKAYQALVEAEGRHFPDALAAIADAHQHKLGDEFILPSVIGNYRGMHDGDGLLCFNFRADRVRQILAALLDPKFQAFERSRFVHFAAATGMTQYSEELDKLLDTIVAPLSLPNVLGAAVAQAGRTQLRMAETEKYAHVTYFLNGGDEHQFAGEDRILVPSPKVATYDLQPEMAASELTDRAVAAIDGGRYDLIVLNYANPDMVGHTGKLDAAIEAVEAVDTGLGRIVEAIRRAGGALLVTADHGNCELMRDPQTGGPHTSHTTNPVPVVLLDGGDVTLAEGRLADIAPTLLDLMDLPKPAEMTGRTLIRRPVKGEIGAS
jgi:2,3-bisphosphoglycerate-independent phosphoglycerate mutase